MYEGCMIYRFAGFPIYAADNRPFKTKRTREDALCLPSYINCTSYIVPSYIFLAPSFFPSSTDLRLLHRLTKRRPVLPSLAPE